MDKVYIYWRFGSFSGVECGWRKYCRRPLSVEKAKAKIGQLRTTRMNVEFRMAGDDGRIVEG